MGCTGSTAVVENILPIELVVNLDDQESLHDNLLGAEVKCVAPGVHECISASAASLSATNIESTDIERIQYDSGYFKPKEAEVEMEFTTKMLQSRDIAPPGTGQVNIQGDNCDPNNDEYLQKKIQLRDLSRSNALADNRGETFENGSYSYGITTKAGDQSTSMSLRPVGAPSLPEQRIEPTSHDRGRCDDEFEAVDPNLPPLVDFLRLDQPLVFRTRGRIPWIDDDASDTSSPAPEFTAEDWAALGFPGYTPEAHREAMRNAPPSSKYRW